VAEPSTPEGVESPSPLALVRTTRERASILNVLCTKPPRTKDSNAYFRNETPLPRFLVIQRIPPTPFLKFPMVNLPSLLMPPHS
jgi:hypothetical protein